MKSAMHRSKTSSLKQEALRIKPKPVHSEKAKEELSDFTRDFFGVQPEIETVPVDLYGEKLRFRSQAFIALPEGIKVCSPIWREEKSIDAENYTSADMRKMIRDQIEKKEIQVYKGSPMYLNYLKSLRVAVLEYDLTQVFYAETFREDGMVTVIASVNKHGMEYSGQPAFNPNKETARRHAEVMLSIRLSHSLDSMAESAVIFPGRSSMDKLEKYGNDNGLSKIERSNEIVKKDGYEIHKVTFSILGLSESGYGITPEHARELAAKRFYAKLLMEVSASNS